MKLIPLTAITLALAAANVSALEWPWSQPDVERMEYCKGLVTAGLTSQQTAGHQRRDLWLAWNYLIRTGGAGHAAAPDQFKQGRNTIEGAADAEAIAAALEEAARDCGLRRSGLQITGL